MKYAFYFILKVHDADLKISLYCSDLYENNILEVFHS